MRNLLIALILVTLSFGALLAQTDSSRTMINLPVFGLKGGVNISQITGDDAYDSSDTRLGLHVGVLMQYNLLRTIYFQPEFIYTQKGYNYQYSLLGLDTKVKDQYDYLEVPLLVKLNFAADGFKIQPYAGPAFGALIGAKSIVTVTDGSSSASEEYKIRDDMRVLEMSLVVGADLVVMDRLMVGARYNFGLSKIYKDSMPGIGTNVQNGVFMVSIGYLFNGAFSKQY